MMMKVCLTITIFALAGVIRVQAEGNLQTCIDPNTFDPNKDYFPDKVEPLDSEHWEIEYFNSYKILRNTVDDESFVLYQCGTPVPTTTINNGDEKFLHVIPVPLQDGAALTSTTHIPHFEQLGILDQVKGWIGDTSFISSPCLNGRMETGDVEIVLRSDRGNQTLVDGLKSSVGEGMVYFHSSGDDFSSTLLNVTVSAYKEKKNEAIYEWNKFFAVFFNLEAKSNELVSAASARYECYTEEAREVLTAVTDGVKPNVIWASWNNWTGVPGWDIARCPNYYCEYAELCSAEILSRDENDGTVEYYGRKIHSPEAFFEIAKDYDAFIYAAFDWDDVYELYRDELDQFKSVQDKRVFDVLGSGENTWFEQRLAEYEIVMQDFCSVVGTANTIHVRKWLRNVFTEEPRKFVSTCADPALTDSFVSRATACEMPKEDPRVNGATSGGVIMAIATGKALAAAVWTLFVAAMW